MAQPEEQQLTLSTSSSEPTPTRRLRAKTMGNLRSKKRKKTKSSTPKQSKSSHKHKFKQFDVPRKLGPRDMGRIKYKQGTKYEETQTYGTSGFLDEKIDRHARASSFLTRKTKNPVQKKETVEETGTPNDWRKPEYYKSEVQKMYTYHNAKRQGWGGSMQFFTEKPSKPKDARLEALKDMKIPKGKAVKEYGSPHSWKPIEFKYENNGGTFLDEKFWFEASHVQIDGGLSRLIEALPPQQKLHLNKLPAPTGYQSKINFLKHLRDLVVFEVNRINKEDKVLKKMENKAFINEISEEIEKELENEFDEVFDEVFENYENDEINKIDEKNDNVCIELDIIVDDKEDDIVELDNEKDDKLLQDKYKNLLRRKKSDMGMLQRQLLTMKSVNKLTNLIDDMEQQKNE